MGKGTWLMTEELLSFFGLSKKYEDKLLKYLRSISGIKEYQGCFYLDNDLLKTTISFLVETLEQENRELKNELQKLSQELNYYVDLINNYHLKEP